MGLPAANEFLQKVTQVPNSHQDIAIFAYVLKLRVLQTKFTEYVGKTDGLNLETNWPPDFRDDGMTLERSDKTSTTGICQMSLFFIFIQAFE
jgi:hypothetical protein